MYLHHEDEELLGRHYGSPDLIPAELRVMCDKASKFYHGACGGSGPIPGPTLLSLVVACDATATVTTPKPQKVEPEEKPESDIGPTHHPIHDLPKHTRLRVDGKLGYLESSWGQDKVKVKMEGDEKARVVSVLEVELAV